MIQLSRKEAEEKINAHWAVAKAECLKVNIPFRDYAVERLRNYEIEQELLEFFGEEHVISEWCPFNGQFCKWEDYCPIKDLEELFARFVGKGIVDQINYDIRADQIRRQINKRLSKVQHSGAVEFPKSILTLESHDPFSKR